MRIDNPATGEYVMTSCTGCLCHELQMRFGKNVDTCEECGCPKTLVGFREYQRKHGVISKKVEEE